MRDDLALISRWIPRGARVLDLGCGDGDLLAHLQDDRQVNGYGLEIDQDNIAACFAKGVNVIEQDLDKGLGNFQSDRFDIIEDMNGGTARVLLFLTWRALKGCLIL